MRSPDMRHGLLLSNMVPTLMRKLRDSNFAAIKLQALTVRVLLQPRAALPATD